MITTYKDLLKRVEKFKIDQNLDLSSGEDLSIGIMNLISIEEHLFFTYNKTKDPTSLKLRGASKKYLDLLNEIRTMRIELMKEIVKDYEGEIYCISKHLLAASMRIMEVGTKELKKSHDLEHRRRAQDLFAKSYQLYSLFWGLNLQAVKAGQVKQVGQEKAHFIDEKGKKKSSISVFSKLSSLIQKAIDCCKE